MRKAIIRAALLLTWSTTIHATIITHGDLTTDDTTNYITDTVTGRLYTRFDAFNLSYADTLTAVSTGGAFEGWTIATTDIAVDFINAALGVATTDCLGSTSTWSICGNMMGWNEGDFGLSGGVGYDYFAYLNDGKYSDHPIGLGGHLPQLAPTDIMYNWEYWNSVSALDANGISNPNTKINLLLYFDEASTVPEPSIAWLLGAGLALIGLARRKT